MKQKISSIIFSSGLPESDFLSLGNGRPAFMSYFGGRFTCLDLYLSMARHVRSDVDYVVTSRHAEFVHNYMEKGWGETGWEILPFIPESDVKPFNKNMLNAFKAALRPWVLLCRADNPSYLDLTGLTAKVKRRTKALVARCGKSAPTVILVEKGYLMDQLSGFLKKKTDAGSLLPALFRHIVRDAKSDDVEVEGFAHQIRNLDQYIDAHRGLLSGLESYNSWFARVPLHSGVSPKKQAVIERNGEVYNSMLADGVHVFGSVRNSILYPGVIVGRGCEISDSIILPGIALAPGVKITRSLIGEGTPLSQNNKYHIPENVQIGKPSATSAAEGIPLAKGYTFFSTGAQVPRGISIGANCYLGPEVVRTRFKRVKNISDGRILT